MITSKQAWFILVFRGNKFNKIIDMYICVDMTE